jgi:hypothetical protein
MKKKGGPVHTGSPCLRYEKGAGSYLFVPPQVTGVQLEESCARLISTAYGMPPTYLQEELTRPANVLCQIGACARAGV